MNRWVGPLSLMAAAIGGCNETAEGLNQPPQADAGPDRQVQSGEAVELDGSASADPDGSLESILWIQAAGPEVDLQTDGLRARFSAPDVSATLRFTLLVTDDRGASATDDVQVEVLGNGPPVADAGADQDVFLGRPVVLDGTASRDPDGDLESFAWEQTAGEIVSLQTADGPVASFDAPSVAGRLEFRLTVTDARGATSTDSTQVFVTTNQPPIADAGPDRFAASGASVSLDGSSSADPDGQIEAHRWMQVGGPSTNLVDSTEPVASVTVPDGGGVLEFELEVTDDQGARSTDRVRVVAAGQQPQIVVTFPTQDADFEARATESVIRGRIQDPDGTDPVRVTVDGMEASLDPDDPTWWSAPLPLSTGAWSVRIEAEDEGGDVAQLDWSLQSQVSFTEPMGLAVAPDGRRYVVLDEEVGFVDVTAAGSARTQIVPRDKPPFVEPTHLGFGQASDVLYALDVDADAIFSIELPSGRANLVSGENRGEGPSLQRVRAMTTDPETGSAYVLVADAVPVILSVDLDTGDRQLVSGPGQGSGPLVGTACCMALDPDGGRLFVGGPVDLSIVDLQTGDRSFVARPRNPPSFGGMVWDAMAGELLVAGENVRRVDLQTGVQSAVSATSNRPGTVGLVLDPNGTGRVSTVAADRILAVDLTTGQQTDAVPPPAVGTGPELRVIEDLQLSADGATLWSLGFSIDDREFHLTVTDVDTSERTRPYARLNSGPFTGPAVFAFDGERDRFLFGEDGATTCGLTALDRSTGDLDSLTTEVCPQAILPDPNEGTLWISNRDSRPLFGIIEGVWRVAMDGSSAQPFSGPDRGAGAPLEDPSPGSLLLDPGGRALLALDRNAVASVDIPSGDRAVAFSSLQDTGRARLNPNLDRGLVVIERNDTFVSVDLEVGTKDVWFRTPDGLAGAFAIDGPNRRLFYARTGVFEPGAILVIDTASGEWAVHAR